MRTPKMVQISSESYYQNYWPNIKSFLQIIFSTPQQTNMTMQEEFYRLIYHICCQQHFQTLNNDLMNWIAMYLEEILFELSLPNQSSIFFEKITFVITNFLKSTDVIAVIFKYWEKHYLLEKQGKTLRAIFISLFNQTVLSSEIVQKNLKICLNTIPNSIDPTKLMNLIKGIYEIDPNYISLNPQLFSLYIPNLNSSKGLETDIIETQELISKLKQQGFTTNERPLKRKYASLQ